MGIPHLATSLQRFANHRALQDESVVIDGPALAHHMLNICRVNDASPPSYNLIAKSYIRWLDGLYSHRVIIEAIYFDGHLPSWKRTVAVDDRDQLDDVFATGTCGFRPFVEPSFFVPAIIESLRQHPRYKTVTFVVPGEADAYCAAHVSQMGGLVLTSDSDLLVYNLREGQVAFLRDIYQNTYAQIVGSVFSPKQIGANLKLPPSEGLLRLAYEHSRAPQSTLSAIYQSCSREITNHSGYEKFSKLYELPAISLWHPLDKKRFRRLVALDPRVSEVAVRISSKISTNPDHADDVHMYLPLLLEDSSSGSAWEHSRPLRQLAYAVFQLLNPRREMEVLEYRRVQDVSQKGRSVERLSTKQIEHLSEAFLIIIERMKSMAITYSISPWHLVGMAIEANECQTLEKQSFTWSILQMRHDPSMTKTDRIPWNILHFSAHLQAALYSLRMLSQALITFSEMSPDRGLPWSARQLQFELRQLPPLADFPDVDDAMQLLLLPSKDALIEEFGAALHLTMAPASESQTPAKTKKRAASEQREDGSRTSLPGSKRAMNANMFGLLSIESD
ncbi:DNA replication initiation factor cdc45 [Ophiocordyceps camponoti-floridani]|uniref:DNA replication initiation factor cdc45 n=1 Tax=Ophiocordyceps camponoti-floridani TaxID=2030778 RepID=A0A8H4Q3I4_9HYPO|nr:DNA replication initiation factor cdc45 [Ophiocordyceps camponoti-floridani]